MEKLLTISIAAYNVENYIKQTLDSLVESKYIDELEIFIVDDGGTDKTIEIANEYRKEFPNSIFPLSKENGGYGTTVNLSLSKATGRYFKLLDGDDWFDTQELDQWVEVLRQTTSDVIVTNFVKYREGSGETEVISYSNITQLKMLKLSSVEKLPTFGMWSLAFKTQLLRDVELVLPERLLYTDQIFATKPFLKARTIEFMPFNIYYYRIGRDGQSVSRDSRIKNIHQTITVFEEVLKFYNHNKGGNNYRYLLQRISLYYVNVFKTFLLLPTTQDNLRQLKEYEKKMQQDSPNVFEYAATCGKAGKLISVFRKTNYILYWAIKLLPNGFPNWE